MTEYLKARFQVPFMGDGIYRDNWSAIFEKKEPEPESAEPEPTPAPEPEHLTATEKDLDKLGTWLPGGGVRMPRGWTPGQGRP